MSERIGLPTLKSNFIAKLDSDGRLETPSTSSGCQRNAGTRW